MRLENVIAFRGRDDDGDIGKEEDKKERTKERKK